jgi:Uma2 family endonuclease
MRNRATLSPMNLTATKPMTLAEFLAWEERQELRYEFDGSEPVAMAGGSLAHAAIQRNLALALGSRLRGKPCQFFGSDLKIQAAENSSRYPDGMVICSGLDPTLKIVRNPVVIFEVLSPSTAAADRIVKARESSTRSGATFSSGSRRRSTSSGKAKPPRRAWRVATPGNKAQTAD